TFLTIMRTGDGNNRTGWSDPRYDELLREADVEVDPAKRLDLLARAEAILLDGGAIIPIYHYASTELVKPYVRGLYSTVLDTHPLTHVWIDRDWARHPAPVAAR